ncbi:MAG: protein kinase [Anaerolineales bacterium]|nr:protein kinase [Anaerolineales bacterium]
MDNPYISRGPVRNPEMFFGREHELNEMAAFLRGNQSVSIVGPRKIGKTSLLFHLMRPQNWPVYNLDTSYLFVYLDCEVMGDLEHNEIFGTFAAEMQATCDERGLEPEPLLEKAIESPSRLSWERALRRLNQQGLRVVIILDEFERLSINENLDVNFFNSLRSAAGRYQLAFITASAHPLIELTYSGRSQEILSSPFFNIFAPLFLGLLSQEQARALIQVPAARVGQEISEELTRFIYGLVGGHPLGLQVACFHALDTPDDPDEIERCTRDELVAHYQYYWNNLSVAEKDTLHHLSDAATRSLTDTTLRGVLRDLLLKCLLVRQENTYFHPARLWEAFVNSQQPSPPSTFSRPGAFGLLGLIGQYEVGEPIARGGMSELYKGRHTRLDREVAIKILPASLAKETDFRERFEREARAIASLKHNHIVQVFDFGDIEGTYYMVMEYIAGDDLSHLIQQHGAMPYQQVALILEQIGSALDYAHGQGLIHRDVKPSNVMLEQHHQTPRAILTDFGIAKLRAADTGATKTGMMMGTLNYIAPEQIRSSGQVDYRADLYSLGVMLYQMLTGELPFKGDNPGNIMMAHLQQPAPDPRLILPDLAETAAQAVLQALEKAPENRPPNASLIAQAFLS